MQAYGLSYQRQQNILSSTISQQEISKPWEKILIDWLESTKCWRAEKLNRSSTNSNCLGYFRCSRHTENNGENCSCQPEKCYYFTNNKTIRYNAVAVSEVNKNDHQPETEYKKSIKNYK
jgi:hypothetical protein